MGYARKEIYRDGDFGTYHCMSRCVRQAFLCGKDRKTKKSYEHRREWIRSRLAFLTEGFAIEPISYTIMSNHLHSILRTRPDIAATWQPEEIARRWLLFFPKKNSKIPLEQQILQITEDPKRVELLRKRLCSISWFNKLLNENIARRANAEEKCKGHFWEARFKCQKILDISGAIACSVYVDLNPIRAKAATTPESSNFTSVQDRIKQEKKIKTPIPLLSIPEAFDNRISLSDYLLLVDFTGRAILSKKGHIPDYIKPILARLGIVADSWIHTTENLSTLFKRVIGKKGAIQAEAILKKHRFIGRCAADKAFS